MAKRHVKRVHIENATSLLQFYCPSTRKKNEILDLYGNQQLLVITLLKWSVAPWGEESLKH